MRLLLAALILLSLPMAIFAGDQRSEAKRVAAIRKGHAADLAILEDYRRNSDAYLGNGKILKAADHVFHGIDFIGLSQESVEALLGTPDRRDPSRPSLFYNFGNGEIAVLPEFELDERHRVKSLKFWPSQ
jgi:hypothetical protein